MSLLKTASLLIVMTTLLTACGESEDAPAGASQETTQITLVTMQLKPTFDAYFDKIITDFEAKHPGVDVRWDDFPYDGYDTKVMTLLAGPNPPDVVNFPSETVRPFVESGMIQPFEGFVTDAQLAEYVPALLEDAGRYDGKVYALPWYAATNVILVNTDVWEKAGLTEADYPKNAHDLRRICEQVRANTEAFGFFPFYTEVGSLKMYFNEAGIEMYNEDFTRAIFNTPKGVEVLKFWTDLYKDGLVPKETITATHRRPIELFKSGRLAIIPVGPQFIRQIKGDAQDIYENLWVGKNLTWTGEEEVLAAVHTLVLSKKTKHPELAAELAATITNNANQLEFCKLTTIFPSTSSALDDPYFANPDESPEGRSRMLGAEQLKHSKVYVAPPRSNDINQILNRTMEEVCYGKKTPEEALAEAEEQVNALLAR